MSKYIHGRKLRTKQFTEAVAVGLALMSASAGIAQTSKPMAHKALGKMTAAKTVSVCKDCKEYFSPAAAKKMGYKDGMGHKLTQMSKAPAGFMDGAKSKM